MPKTTTTTRHPERPSKKKSPAKQVPERQPQPEQQGAADDDDATVHAPLAGPKSAPSLSEFPCMVALMRDPQNRTVGVQTHVELQGPGRAGRPGEHVRRTTQDGRVGSRRPYAPRRRLWCHHATQPCAWHGLTPAPGQTQRNFRLMLKRTTSDK